jgi:hypothetical protein
VLPPLAGGLVVALIAAPFNVSWTAPWTLFQALVLGLDITALALILVAVQRAWDRRHATVRPARAALSPAAAATRRLRLGFVAVLFGSLGLLVAWVGGRQALADWRLWSALQRVDGVVTRQVMFNFRGRDGLPSANAAAIIRYQVGGKSYETTQRIDPAVAPKYGKGTSVPLLYDPANPGRGRLINPYETFLIGGVLLMLATIFLGVAGMAASRAGAAARLAAAGP